MRNNFTIDTDFFYKWILCAWRVDDIRKLSHWYILIGKTCFKKLNIFNLIY